MNFIKPRHIRKIFRLAILIVTANVCICCNLPSNSVILTPTLESTSEQTVVPVKLQPSQTETIVPTESFIPEPTLTASSMPEPSASSMDINAVNGVTLILKHAQRDAVKTKLEELVAVFNQDNIWGITVKLENELSDNYLHDALVQTEIDGEILPDMVLAESSWLRALSSEGFVPIDLQAFVEHDKLGLEAISASPYLPQMLGQEEIFDLPLWHMPVMLFYNKTWAQELGFDKTPDSLFEFQEQACKAAEALRADNDNENDGTGGWIINTSAESAMSWMLNFGLDDPADPADFPVETDSAIFSEVSEWLYTLSADGCIWESRLSEPHRYFADRYALFYTGTFSDIAYQLNAFEDIEVHQFDNWDIIPYPRRSENGILHEAEIFSNPVSISVISRDKEKQLASWLFISWLTQENRLTDLALSAKAWPVQQGQQVEDRYRSDQGHKIFQTLGLRDKVSDFPINNEWETDRLVLADGFAHVFSMGMTLDKIPEIWNQIQQTIVEINR